ncbi:(R,R)-butanediol dehydrogenase / meso-butanediol dehydrogenase / diacetyl reductase [Propionispira arboris]|uniref:(R,R)-butanediol dehydrogenase / meso-butanediol dehydrogenase / diacetyl reductase n=1 Tax=Propionispira arboris TaxID=84035 RepID=A0A1H6XK07_9FIRM|nr:alcohol dehydrogenase catalytic domain-containing protein [Propionispira arboris]SEJ29419.1 (R,R)-butanediol dehydrogenase / meso-butanediol dehydrogenase / diacetyl reductase [Propionispira arboris]
MSTMKQLWFTAKNKVALRNVEIPKVERNQVRVKIAYTALCATDIHQVSMGLLGAKPPMPLGHEASGVIEELGAGTEKSGLKIGDKVCLYPVTHCGICPACTKGQPQYCENSQTTGAFAEYVVTDISAIFKIPDDANLMAYCLVEPANCTVRAMDLVGIKHGASVLISGIGGIGSIMLNMILLSGGAKITASDPVGPKRQLALDMGAQYVIDPMNENLVARAAEITDGCGFDYVFEMSGSPQAAEPTLKVLAKCGTMVYFAVYPPQYTMPLNLYDLYMKEGRIQTVFTTTTIMPRTINLIPRLQMDKIIGKVMPLSEAVESFEVFKKSIYPKILLDCSK